MNLSIPEGGIGIEASRLLRLMAVQQYRNALGVYTPVGTRRLARMRTPEVGDIVFHLTAATDECFLQVERSPVAGVVHCVQLSDGTEFKTLEGLGMVAVLVDKEQLEES